MKSGYIVEVEGYLRDMAHQKSKYIELALDPDRIKILDPHVITQFTCTGTIKDPFLEKVYMDVHSAFSKSFSDFIWGFEYKPPKNEFDTKIYGKLFLKAGEYFGHDYWQEDINTFFSAIKEKYTVKEAEDYVLLKKRTRGVLLNIKHEID